MSATTSCLTAPQAGLAFGLNLSGGLNFSGQAVTFSTLMRDEAKTIARHLVIDWQRAKKTQSLDALTDPQQENPLQLANEKEPSPLHQVLSREKEADLHTSLEKIPAIYREVLVLRFQEELQIEEMAGVLSIPVSTVKSRLYRGLDALRGALQGGTA